MGLSYLQDLRQSSTHWTFDWLPRYVLHLSLLNWANWLSFPGSHGCSHAHITIVRLVLSREAALIMTILSLLCFSRLWYGTTLAFTCNLPPHDQEIPAPQIESWLPPDDQQLLLPTLATTTMVALFCLPSYFHLSQTHITTNTFICHSVLPYHLTTATTFIVVPLMLSPSSSLALPAHHCCH